MGNIKTKSAAAALGVLLVIVVGFVFFHGENRLEARLLMATPDNIPGQPDLVDYATPIGKKAFAANCAECHGADLHGDSTKGIPNLVDNDFLYGTGRLSDIERVVMYGIRSGSSKGWDLASMPAYGKAKPYPRYELASLSPGQIDDLADYLRSFQNLVEDQEAVKRGEELFHAYKQGVCWDCHATDAMGDSAIGAPNLTDPIWLYGDGSAEWIKTSITHGLGGSCPAYVDTLPLATIRSIAVYIHSLIRPPGQRTAAAQASAN